MKPFVHSDEQAIVNDNIQAKDCNSESFEEERLLKEKTVPKGIKVYIRLIFTQNVHLNTF